MSEIRVLTLLKDQLVLFFDELIGLFPKEGDLIMARIFLKDQIPITIIMDYICDTLMPLKTYIEEKDERFFLEHNILFEKLDSNKVNYFKGLWTSGVLSNSNKDTIWDWFRAFILLAEKYEKCKGKYQSK